MVDASTHLRHRHHPSAGGGCGGGDQQSGGTSAARLQAGGGGGVHRHAAGGAGGTVHPHRDGGDEVAGSLQVSGRLIVGEDRRPPALGFVRSAGDLRAHACAHRRTIHVW